MDPGSVQIWLTVNEDNFLLLLALQTANELAEMYLCKRQVWTNVFFWDMGVQDV